MSGHYVLTNADAPPRFDGEIAQGYLQKLVEALDATNPEMGGVSLEYEARVRHDAAIVALVYRLYGVATFDRYTYVADVDDAPDAEATT
jgi:hypothetical protein